MHGVPEGDDEDSERLSDLPKLMAKYEPGMRLSSVTAFYDKMEDSTEEGLLLGLRAQLEHPNSNRPHTLDLVSIGEDPEEDWE